MPPLTPGLGSGAVAANLPAERASMICFCGSSIAASTISNRRTVLPVQLPQITRTGACSAGHQIQRQRARPEAPSSANTLSCPIALNIHQARGLA